MESKPDVKTIMARFSTGSNNTSTSDLPSYATGHPKTPLHPTLSSGPPIHIKKPVLETRSGGALSLPPKPSSTRSSVTKSAPEVRELANTRALAGMYSGSQDDGKPSVVKQHPFRLKALDSPSSFSSQEMEAKIPPLKPLKSPPGFTAPETRPVFPKPPPASFPKPPSASFPKPPPASLPKPPHGGVSKPPWMKEDSNEGNTPPRLPPLQKPPSSFAKLRQQQSEDGGEAGLDPKPVNGSALKSSNFRTGQSVFNKEGQSDNSGGRDFPKPPLTPSNSTPVVPPASKKPSIVRKHPQVKEDENADPLSAPKKNPLPNIWALGTAPAKPNRPPRVTLDSFRREAGTDGAIVKKITVPPPPAFHPTNHMTPPPPPPSHPAAPILPPRPIIQPDQDENYDDIGVSRPEQGDSSDEEMYEDLDERWGPAEKEQEKKKEDKKKQDVNKKEQKEQKEREKKEQEARKKFKVTGPVQVVHRAKARVDCKGGRTDLGMKQGDTIDIIRVQDNPKGCWLGRTQDGAYGYVKTELMEVDIESLKRQGAHDPEIYDDVDFSEKGPAVVLPPPPEEDGDIYDDLEDPNFISSPSSPQESRGSPKTNALGRMLKGLEDWRKIPRTNTHLLPPPQFLPEGKSAADQSEVDQEIYDDIDTQGFPVPPPLSSHPLRSKEMDPKKLKKLEKEEKEFRKKFKFDGEIMVLYQVTVTASPSTKKGGGKELQLTPGELLDVISKPVDNKLICRNNEGKFGYVQTSNIVAEDCDIYDDIDASVYDND